VLRKSEPVKPTPAAARPLPHYCDRLNCWARWGIYTRTLGL